MTPTNSAYQFGDTELAADRLRRLAEVEQWAADSSSRSSITFGRTRIVLEREES